MDDEPWRADRVLDAEGVRSTLREQFPRLALRSVRFLGSGWDYDAYLVDEDLVVRFPRRREVADRLEREEETLAFVAAELERAVRVPVICLRGRPDRHVPHRYFGHRAIPGVRADHPDLPRAEGLAADLGAALTRIHSIPPERAVEAGLRTEEATCAALHAEVSELVRARPAVEALAPDAVRWLAVDAVPPPEYEGPRRFLHNDLCPDHLLVDPSSGRLSGVIDWSDAALGDPALDFVAVVLWRGWPFGRAVLDRYDRPVDDGFQDRLDFLARVLSIEWLDEAIRRGADLDKHRRWVRNAFGAR